MSRTSSVKASSPMLQGPEREGEFISSRLGICWRARPGGPSAGLERTPRLGLQTSPRRPPAPPAGGPYGAGTSIRTVGRERSETAVMGLEAEVAPRCATTTAARGVTSGVPSSRSGGLDSRQCVQDRGAPRG
jgi:hypothetical protein